MFLTPAAFVTCTPTNSNTRSLNNHVRLIINFVYHIKSELRKDKEDNNNDNNDSDSNSKNNSTDINNNTTNIDGVGMDSAILIDGETSSSSSSSSSTVTSTSTTTTQNNENNNNSNNDISNNNSNSVNEETPVHHFDPLQVYGAVKPSNTEHELDPGIFFLLQMNENANEKN